jgi:isocitrate lyase
VETISQQAARLQDEWSTNPRWKDTERTYSAQDAVRLRGSVAEEFTLARRGAERLRKLLAEEDAVAALGALTGNQAVQQVKAGLQAIYLSGWQVAADANLAGQTYPDQSLYPVNSVPQVVRRINNALLRADQITWSESEDGDTAGSPYWLAPIVADAEAGFGGVLNAFELMKAMIAAGAAGVHWEDQLASEKKCGHLGGKVLIPTGQHIKTLNAARLAADVCDVPTLIIARTDAQAATLLTADVDERDQPFVTGGCATESSRASPGAWPTHRTPTCSGWRHPSPTSRWPGRSPRASRTSTRTRCSPSTARPRSTGARIWTRRPLPSSARNSPRWVTGSSSSRWLASTP